MIYVRRDMLKGRIQELACFGYGTLSLPPYWGTYNLDCLDVNVQLVQMVTER